MNNIILERIWLSAGLMLLGMLFLKACIDIDPSWDSLAYHLPFAGRLSGISPMESYQMDNRLEQFYLGLPKLCEWLQGLLWRFSGRMQAANLVCLFSLAGYVYFLQTRFQVPLGHSLIALLAIPLVQIHATSSYVDLPANLCLSALVLLTWQLFYDPSIPTSKIIWPLFVTALLTAHSKMQLIPFACAYFAISAARIACIRRPDAIFIGIGLCMLLLIIAVPIKNSVLYGNPFYPLAFSIGGHEFSHPFNQDLPVPAYLSTSINPVRWFYSVIEARRPFGTWNIDMLLVPKSLDGNRMGGYFNLYVLMQLLMFIALYRKDHNPRRYITPLLFALVTFLAASIPQSHELRYYQHWMIILVSLNLIQLRQMVGSAPLKHAMDMVACASFAVIVWCTNGFFLIPQGIALENLPAYAKKVSPFPFSPATIDASLLMIDKHPSNICIVGQHPIAFLYSDIFHPPAHYSTISAASADDCTTHTGN